MYGQFVIYILRHFNQLRDNKSILKIAFMSGDRDLHLPGQKKACVSIDSRKELHGQNINTRTAWFTRWM